MDKSKALAELASRYIGQQVVVGSYHTINYAHQFDAIWACASLLHIPKQEIDSVFEGILRALRPEGIWYMSFKHGTGETEDSLGRFFNNYTIDSLEKLVRKFEELTILDSWVESSELRGKQQKWVNMLVQKRDK
ncbi:MAG: class I SAM-dependent methyltransferase [Thermodesulfobacteriota bacterium]|nr:class I SAM-dependent methyltransferase [Thermodesulfobacteriota bacterium]